MLNLRSIFIAVSLVCAFALSGCKSKECVKAEHIGTLPAEPSAVEVLARITTCKGESIHGVDRWPIEVHEDGVVVPSAVARPRVHRDPSAYRIYTVLLLDMSGARGKDLTSIKEAAKAFARMARMGDSTEVAIYAFDGSKHIQQVSEFERNEFPLTKAIDAMTCGTVSCRRGANLNGAVVEGLARLDSLKATGRVQNPLGNLVIFTTSADRAGHVPDAEAADALAKTRNQVITIGVRGFADEDTLRSYGKTAHHLIKKEQDLVATFEKVGGLLWREAESFYLIRYCSPQRSGIHEATLRVGKHSIVSRFNAEGFADGCAPQRIRKPTGAWALRHGTPGAERAVGLHVDGDIWTTGTFTGKMEVGGAFIEGSPLGKERSFVTVTTDEGYLVGATTIRGYENSLADSATNIGNVGVVLVGTCSGSQSWGGKTYECGMGTSSFVALLDDDLEQAWMRVFRNDTEVTAESVAMDSNGHIVVSGLTNSATDFGAGALGKAEGNQPFVVRLDRWGRTTWARVFEVSDGFRIADVGATNDGGAIVAANSTGMVSWGEEGGFADDGDFFVGKLNSKGEPDWYISPGSEGAVDQATALHVGLGGDIFVTGHTRGVILGQEHEPEGQVAFVTLLTEEGKFFGSGVLPGGADTLLTPATIDVDTDRRILIGGSYRKETDTATSPFFAYWNSDGKLIEASVLPMTGTIRSAQLNYENRAHLLTGFTGSVNFNGIDLRSAGSMDIGLFRWWLPKVAP